MSVRQSILLTSIAVIAAWTSQAFGATAAASAGRCEALSTADFSNITDAPTKVSSAEVVGATGDMPAYCRVRGYVAPRVGFELQLPESQWSGRFVHVGCGGLCGKIEAAACEPALRRGYSCVASDMGHSSNGMDAAWAYDNLQSEVDFAFRATHVATLAAKAIGKRYYDRAPQYSYFVGCSQGGRQALIEAQRFPEDFSGIVAGAPVNRYALTTAHLLWASQVAAGDGSGQQGLSTEALQTLHAAVLGACDLNDGVADGIIANPPGCRFDPASLVCSATRKDACLTSAQATLAKRLYAGLTRADGTRVYWGVAPGSELNWSAFLGKPGEPSIAQKLAIEKLRYLTFMPDPGPKWQASDFVLERDVRRFGLMESLYDATNPDLRRFGAAGGKLLMYQGWSDPNVPPGNIIDYYETVERTLGGRAASEKSVRLFVLPGVGHCGVSATDYLTYIERWVEQGRAPDPPGRWP